MECLKQDNLNDTKSFSSFFSPPNCHKWLHSLDDNLRSREESTSLFLRFISDPYSIAASDGLTCAVLLTIGDSLTLDCPPIVRRFLLLKKNKTFHLELAKNTSLERLVATNHYPKGHFHALLIQYKCYIGKRS